MTTNEPEMCEHLAKDCLHAAERTETHQTRELLLKPGLVDARRGHWGRVRSSRPGFGIGGVILVAINIERRRNSDFVIYR